MSRLPPRNISVFTSHKMTSISGRKNTLFSHPHLLSRITETAHCLYYVVHHDSWERDLSHSDTSQFRKVLLLFHFTCLHLKNRETVLNYSTEAKHSIKEASKYILCHVFFLIFFLSFFISISLVMQFSSYKCTKLNMLQYISELCSVNFNYQHWLWIKKHLFGQVDKNNIQLSYKLC